MLSRGAWRYRRNVTPEQATKIQLAALTVAAYARGDHAQLDRLVFSDIGGPDEYDTMVALADGLMLLAVESALTLSQIRESTVNNALNRVEQRDENFIAGAQSHWGEAVAAAKDIYHKRVPASIDNLADGVTSAFNLAYALIDDIATRAGSDPAWFAEQSAAELARRSN